MNLIRTQQIENLEGFVTNIFNSLGSKVRIKAESSSIWLDGDINFVNGDNIYIGQEGNNIIIKNTLTKLSQLTDDIVSGKYLPLTGGVVTGNITSNSFIKAGGTSSQFLKADGSVDNNVYLTSDANINGILQNLNDSSETSKPYHQVERGFIWINGAVENFGQYNEATGSFISFGNNSHKGQLFVSKTGILFRGVYGDNDNPDWLNVWHNGNFEPTTKANVNGDNTVGGTWKIDNIFSSIINNSILMSHKTSDSTSLYWGYNNLNNHIFQVYNATSGFNVYSTHTDTVKPIWSGHNFNPDTKANVNGENTVGGTWKIQLLLSPSLYGDNTQVFSAGGDTIYWGNPTLPHHRFEVNDATTGFKVYDIIRGEKPIWSGHNFDPDTKFNVKPLLTTDTNNITPYSSQELYYKNLSNSPYSSQDVIGSITNLGGKTYGFDIASIPLNNNIFVRTYDRAQPGSWFSLYHSGNFNPDTKANTSGNYQGLIVGNSTTWNGQSYTSIEFTGTPSWLLTYDISTDSWKPTSNITVANWLRTEINKINPAGLKEATYGMWYGIVQEYSSDNPTDDWYNKLKILHGNSNGFSTELAQNFGSEGIFYRSTVQGQTSNWTKLWDKNDFNDTRVNNWDNAYNAIGFPLSNLQTSDKSNLVNAINSIQTNVGTIKSENVVDGLGLDDNKFYPITIPITSGNHKVKIKISRPLSQDMGVPSYSIHPLGFSGSFEIITNGSSWGGFPVHQVTTNNTWIHVNSPIIVNGATQINESSIVIIWVRGGSKYYVTVNDVTKNPTPELKREDWLWDADGSGTYTRWIRVKDIEDIEDIAQSRESYLRRSGDTMYGNIDFIGTDKGVAFNNTWIWRADLNNNLNLTRIGVVDNVLLVDAVSRNFGVDTHNAIARMTVNGASTIENNNNGNLPDNIKLALLNNNECGTLFYTTSDGAGHIQQQYVNGFNTPDSLNLNPKGGTVKIGSVAGNYTSNVLETHGRIITLGSESNSVLQFTGNTINQYASATEYRWYNDYWTIGNVRGGSSETVGFETRLNGAIKFLISPNGDAYTVLNHYANAFYSNIHGDSGQWNEAYTRWTIKYVDNLDNVINNGFYRQENPTNAFPYSATLNLNSIDGRQQLMIDREGNGMRFRSSKYNNGADWSEWKSVKTGHTRTVIVNTLSANKFVGLRFARIGIGPCKVVVTVQGIWFNSNIGGSALVKEYCFYDNGDTGFHSQSSRSISAYGTIAEAYRLSDGVYWNGSGEISCNLHGLPAASLGNPLKITIDYYLYDERNFGYISAWVTEELDDTSGIGKDKELSLNDGSNTVGGTWKINVIESPQFASSLGIGQIFNATAGGTLFLGNPAIPLITIETTNAVDFGVYTPTGGRRQIWNGHNFDPGSKVNISGDNATGNWGINAYGINAVARGTDDAFRIIPIVYSADNIELEIATADNGNEPIVVRQYNGNATNIDTAFQTKAREAYLLDGAGNTSFPGIVRVNKLNLTGTTTTPIGQVSTESSIHNVGGDYGYGISMNQHGGLDIMANQPGQPIRLWSGQANANPYKSMELNGSGVSVYGTIFTLNHGNSDYWVQAYNWGNHKAVDSHQYLGATYVPGGIRKPEDFGVGRLKLEMVNGSVLGNGQGWNDVLWLSSYTGGDVPGSNALIMSKMDDEIGFARQNFNATAWGTYRRIWHSGNFDATDVMLKGSAQDVTGHKRFFTNGSEYYDASVELITDNAFLVPSLGFHASGRFAGTIKMIDANSFGFYKQGSTGYANLYVGSIVSSGNGNFSNLELSSAQPFIDFHFGSSTADWTSRIGEITNGVLDFYASSRFRFNGNVYGNDFIGTSDVRLKNTIKDLLPVKIESKYKSFYFNDDKEQVRFGVIAQELEKTNPEFVRTDESGFKSVSYNDLHSSEINYLKNKVNELEIKITEILKLLNN